MDVNQFIRQTNRLTHIKELQQSQIANNKPEHISMEQCLNQNFKVTQFLNLIRQIPCIKLFAHLLEFMEQSSLIRIQFSNICITLAATTHA